MQTAAITKRRTFDEGFKRHAVALLLKSDQPISQLVRQLGVCPRSLRDWKELYGPPVPARGAEVL